MEFNEGDTIFGGLEDPPEASSWNSTTLSNLDIKMDSNFAWLLCSLLSAMIWMTYITYYHSRVLGYVLTRILNRNLFVKHGFIQVGSFTWSVLSGKIMFRDIIYMTNDYTLRIQDGWIIFRWWRAYVPKHVSEDMSHSDTRLSIMLNGFELHVYNRTNLYANLEKIFGLEPHMNIRDDQDNSKEDGETGALTNSDRKATRSISTSSWRDLLPVIKLDILSGRIVFGNRLIPTTLSVNVEEAHFMYSTKPAASRFDLFMHILKCVAENFKVILAPSPKYIGMIDDPPRYMGEGFVVLSSNKVDLYYYMDEPGIMPEEPEMLQLANGDIVESAPPIWGIDIKCGKGTDFSYGPWADRQREHLFKFFFPNSYQRAQPTKPPQPGEKRQVQSFDIRLSTQKDATIDILFSKNKETNAVHINIEPGSYLEITLPWTVQPDGYMTKITGQLLHVEASTSLQFRTLLESETLEFNVKCHYPLAWNDHQDWLLSFTGCKTTVHLIYAHKEFFQDLINDWASKSQPDLLHFIPYTWKFSLIMKEFEIITLCNNYNWIDCSSQNQENAHIAFCGELFDLSFDLPFNEFLPQKIPLRFWIQGESADMSLYIPEVYTSRNILIALDKNAKILDRDGNIKTTRRENIKKWRRICQRSNGWIDCWSVPIVALSINYVYHPQPPLGPPPQANITTPEKEELLLSPMRIPRCRKKPEIQWTQTKDGTKKFDPTSLAPDRVTVDLEIGSSILLVHGSWIRNFIHLKENIFGEDQSFTDMQQEKISTSMVKETMSSNNDDEKKSPFDPRQYRPMDVIVSITMHDIQAHILKNCNEKDPPCPMILLERFGLEMKKQYKETILQVLLSPCVLLMSDSVARPSKDSHVGQGHLMLSGLQIRGHAMFSDEGQHLGEETVEYAWMIEIQLGKLNGKLSTPQIHHLVTSLETLVILVRDEENNLRSPGRGKSCFQSSEQNLVMNMDSDKKGRSFCSQDIKYRMTRVSVDALDLYIIESGTAIHAWMSPIRFSTCNLHGKKVKTGVTGLLPALQIRQFIFSGGGHSSNTNTSGSGRSHLGYAGSRNDDLWLEVGSISFGPLVIEAALSLTSTEQDIHTVQHKFLKLHDERTKRLWFLWGNEEGILSGEKPSDRCGCTGGCAFFGSNRNGRKFFKPSRQDIPEGINIAAFRLNDSGVDPGFGQSILHEGQLVFHTAPYDSCQVAVQDSYFYSKSALLKSTVNVKSQENLTCDSPFLRRLDPSPSVADTHSVTPTPVGDRKVVHRRFSCTSATSARNSRNEVPYSRLTESNPAGLKPIHRELNVNGSVLKVPELDLQPRCSASDSKLALDYFNNENADVKKLEPEVWKESHHSLLTTLDFEDQKVRQEVQRTVSLSSENQSEIFYSADEEIPGANGHSGNDEGNACLPCSEGGSSGSYRYSSDLNIGVPGTQSKPISIIAADSDRNRISAHSSDHDIHTPEHKMRNRSSIIDSGLSNIATSASPRNSGFAFGFQKLSESESNENIVMDSDSNSISSTSFISAMSSQEDNGLVNLHMQINRPIVEAPLLMSSYVNHLSQVGCNNWSQCTISPGCDAYSVPGTLFQKNEEGYLLYVGGNYTPQFYYLKEGFSYLRMISRSGDGQPTPTFQSSRTPAHPYSSDNTSIGDLKEDEDMSLEEEMLKVPCEMGNRSTVLVNFKGDIDVMITPLVLESLQRFIDALTPTLSTLHALTVINHLHFECIRKVKGANILKKEEYLNDLSPTGPVSDKMGEDRNKGSRSIVPSNIYQESITSQTQGVISLPKINFTLLQASVVEEFTPFSALDNIRDFACVSIFAICLDKITVKFHFEKQTKETVQTFQRPIVEPSQKKNRILARGTRPLFIGARQPVETVYSDPIHIESSEKQQSQVIVMLGIRKIHAQLRRLPNESSILKDAVITAIPSQSSKVMFICTKVLSPQKGMDTFMKMKDCPSGNFNDEFLNDDNKLGFIMFETGLEGVSIKVIKQEHFDKAGKETALNEDILSERKEKQKEEPFREKASTVIGQTEQFLTAMRFSSKTAASLNNFIEGRTLRSKSIGKTEVSASKIQTEEQKNNLGDQRGRSDTSHEDSNTSSCVIELNTIWFNFAAPPRTPITRKMDYTRLDWNLLSTASPAINAWMNPSSRFASRLVHLFRCLYRRSSGVVSCLMAEALEVPEIHAPVKSRYARLTPLAKTLQEDPSCQLCNILRKYILQTELATIESNLTEDHLPNLSILRQGVIVLSRQWKSVLYTPLLLDHNYKTKYVKPLNFKITMSESDEDDIIPTEADNSGDENEITDDCAVLINKEAGTLLNSMKNQENVTASATKSEMPEMDSNSFTSPQRAIFRTFQGDKRDKHLPQFNPPSSSRASIVFPIINTNYPFSIEPKFTAAEYAIGYNTLREDKSLGYQIGSNGSNYSNGVLGSHHSLRSLDRRPTEDLYSWMAKQADFAKDDNSKREPHIIQDSAPSMPSVDKFQLSIPGGYNFYPVHDSLCLLDAHLVFEPLLSSLGVMPQQMISNVGGSSNNAVFDTWGSSVSLVASMEAMKIDIVVSECGKPLDRRRGKKGKFSNGKFVLELPSEVPAFVCERIGVEVDVKKLADMAVDDILQKQNVLYISRGQLKKHTSTRLNFSLNIHFISQQVNMPLLRLLHQISSMYQNVKDTQMELREQNLKSHLGVPHFKDNKNGSSSASDLQEHLSPSMTKHLSKSSLSGLQTVINNQKSTLSPSSSLLARPQIFAQKLRSTTKNVKGYINLTDSMMTPILADVEVDKSLKPRCWKTIYYLLDLYAILPETKTISHRFSVAPDLIDGSKNKKLEMRISDTDVEKGTQHASSSTPLPSDRPRELSLFAGERTRLVVFGVARIHRTLLLATLSGLKLEAEITNLHSSVTCRKKLRPESLECSLTGQIGRTMIVLLEGVSPNQQTVVKVTVGKSQALYSSVSRRLKDKNSGLLTVGAINVDIPQHPVVLHGMMTRGSKQLSSTLQELGVKRATRMTRGVTIDETDNLGTSSPNHMKVDNQARQVADLKATVETSLIEPLVMQFSIVLQSLSITAALLPSLQAQYTMNQVNSSGVTGSKAKFTIELPKHSLSFTTKLQAVEANLPSAASIDLPKVHVSAEYIQDGKNTAEAKFGDGVVLREGSYLNATADIGKFEHSLTTDLLNHLVFVQKVFMKEINEVLQKVYGGEKVVPLWQEERQESRISSLKRILFSLVIRIKRIQLTATTPTNSAVRLETGAVEFQLSNRVENVYGSAQPNVYMKIFGKAQVDINLSLGQLLKNVIFEEADPEFQQFAFFKTQIGLRNAFQGEMVEGEDKEVVLITLKRPLIYIQPMAVDKAILVWLNYKNAYEYWNEQRSNLNKEVLTATHQVLEKVPFGQLTSSPHLGTLFLQLTVDDMGICLPLNPLPLNSWGMNRSIYCDSESRGAVVVTLESTSISACSSGSLVSKGRFVGLCLRFADDFETSLDDWKPDMNDSTIMNLCVVSEGTYEVCSRTIAQKQGKENAKWFLSVQWQMEGVDIHLDVNVGKQLSALGHTLTMLTGSTEEDETITFDYDSDEPDGIHASHESIAQRRSRNAIESLPSFVFDPSIDSKRRSKMIEKEMQEQQKIINDLRCLGASYGTIEQEVKRLQDLETMIYKDFRRDMIQRLRRQSVKASTIKGKFGLGKNSASFRSRSFIIPSPTPEHAFETDSPDDMVPISIRSAATSNSFDSSPRSGPSRSASLRVRETGEAHVTFSDNNTICRQYSLPSADSDLSLPAGVSWTEGDHIMIDGEKVRLRKKFFDDSTDRLDDLSENSDSGTKQSSPVLNAHSPGMQKSQEPNIDFELDVKVFINSGKCVLHTKDYLREEELKLSHRMKKERSCSGGMFEFPPTSPNASRRNKDSKQTTSSTRLRYAHGNIAQLIDLTIFRIPGLDVKVHYESRIEMEEAYSPSISHDYSLSPPTLRKSGNKKASLFAWTILQSIPEETIISPHILEFLEKTLEQIPSALVQNKESFTSSAGHTMFTMNGDAGWGSNTATGNYAYASFPVDVMVYFHMEPSTFRFSCLPVSRVECMLQLPSLDIVFSSKRAEEELQNEFGDRTTFSEIGPVPSAVGGLSVTGCLSNFSVHIFHPYGGGKKTGVKEAQWSPLADTERKDSLSINVEFVKFHLSRSRKINFQSEHQSKFSKCSSFDKSRAVIRFSTIVDIGSASFKYDMRRLTEILAFPKAWYRRSIVRRLFLGELNISTMYEEEGESSHSGTDEEAVLQRSESGRYLMDTLVGSRSGTLSKSPMMGRDKERLKLNLSEHRMRFLESGKMNTVDENGPSPSDQTSRPSWETLVLFAVNFTKLRVQMNMGNVMGNVMWLTKDFHSEGRLSIGSTGHKNLYIGLGLGTCNLDAKGGIVGGTIDLSNIDTFVHIREDPGTEPDHTVGLRLYALELRLDYMGTGVLMSRVSSLNVSLRDEWRIHSFKNTDSYIPTRRPAMIFMHGDLGWDQLQIMMSKSTTADLLKMYYKLDEFFSQQFQSSKRVFSSLQPKPLIRSGSTRRKALKKKTSSIDSGSTGSQFNTNDPKHHRHWQNVLAIVGGLNLYTFKVPLPLNGTVLGGTMELHGSNISLACFHGINFKSKSWALFSLKEPCISFATEAQEIPSVDVPNKLDVHIVETLTFSLGMTTEQPHAQHHSMATICRMSRNVLFPPQYKTLQEWFSYAFAGSDIDSVDRFPTIERDRSESVSSEEQKRNARGSIKLQDFNHSREDIFALPSMQLHLKTEHLQADTTPDTSGAKPVVECSFITEFEDHIFVTFDAEAFFFLHDLISSYLKEREKISLSMQGGVKAHSPELERRKEETPSEEDKKSKKSFDSEVFSKDWRTYHCKTWHLEPTVRLWSWTGKSIEPYGIDFILQKLGFSHARTTIPKWMQRGFMDPLDKVLAVLMLHMVSMVREGSSDSYKKPS